MKIGKILLNTEEVYYTPWLPRGGDNAVFSYEVIQALVGGVMAVGVYHKNSEDGGPGALLSQTWTQSGNHYWKTLTGLKELVRFGVACDSGLGTVYRIFPPTWFDAAKP